MEHNIFSFSLQGTQEYYLYDLIWLHSFFLAATDICDYKSKKNSDAF